MPEVEAKTEAYAEKIGKPGVWLDLFDALLLARGHEKQLVSVTDILRGQVEPVDVETFLHDMCNTLCSAKPVDRSNKEMNLLVSCNARYDPGGLKNHYVPAFFPEQVDSEGWFYLTMELSTEA